MGARCLIADISAAAGRRLHSLLSQSASAAAATARRVLISRVGTMAARGHAQLIVARLQSATPLARLQPRARARRLLHALARPGAHGAGGRRALFWRRVWFRLFCDCTTFGSMPSSPLMQNVKERSGRVASPFLRARLSIITFGARVQRGYVSDRKRARRWVNADVEEWRQRGGCAKALYPSFLRCDARAFPTRGTS